MLELAHVISLNSFCLKQKPEQTYITCSVAFRESQFEI